MIEHVMPMCLTISWVYTVAMLVQSIVYEKEQRLKEVSEITWGKCPILGNVQYGEMFSMGKCPMLGDVQYGEMANIGKFTV